ncbi:FT-interacting protein 7 [Camellia lanceoleosa]|uniref:FT-interacting protein 7 n=1 Tax=Camellia lanceoleosa TaxID=1840588 RepID=A0ACC0FLQ7_9ERIC|nr:FT-interacting protein 7 [Camellia lanceoleosa]
MKHFLMLGIQMRFIWLHTNPSKVYHASRLNRSSSTMNAFWNEDLMFVAEPFEDHLILTVEDRVGPNKDEVLGKVIVPLNSVERRADDRLVHSC